MSLPPQTKPRLKRSWQVHVLDGQATVFLGEYASVVLHSRLHAAMAPYLDGLHTITEIAARIGTSAEIVRTLLNRLVEVNCVEFGAETVFRYGRLPDVDGNAGLRVVAVRDWLDESLPEINRAHIAAGTPWLLLKLGGATPSGGPVFTLDGPCWECLAQRIRARRKVHAWTAAQLGRPVAELIDTAVDEAAALAVIARVREFIATPASLHTFHTDAGDWAARPVTRRPECPACGADDERPAGNAASIRRNIAFHTGPGGYRAARAQETWERLKRHVDPLTGIAAEIRDVPMPDPQLHVSVGGSAYEFVSSEMPSVETLFRTRSGGKGATPLHARVSALCETLERYCGIWQGHEPRIRSSYEELEDALPPNVYLGFSDTQFNHRDANNRGAGLKHRVPPRFDPATPIEWTGVWSIDGQRRLWIPSSLCYYGHPESDAPAYCRADSNGAASGNCIEEAFLHALYEIIERDCAAQWWYNRISRPGVDLEAFPGWDFADLRRRYRSLGRDLEVVDITNDVGVPAVAATSADIGGTGPENIVYGFGCHSDPGIAISRAISEVTQSLPAVMHRTPGGRTVYGVREAAAISWWEQATRRTEPYLNPSPGVAARIPTPELPSDLDAVIASITGRFRALGFEIYMLDQSRAEVDLSVVKVFVPGMCHFWNRFGHARLYSVPVKLGWLNAPIAESCLNPWHIYF